MPRAAAGATSEVRRAPVGETTLWLAEAVRRGLGREAARMSPKETGGVLLGYWDAGGETALVTEWIGPGPDAQHTETSFVPDYDYQEDQIALLYAASGRRLSYLGDWHTHPTGSSDLSNTDRACLRRIARSREARASRPLMIVLSADPRWSIAAWQCERRGWGILASYSIREVEVRSGSPAPPIR
jgi:integrative and conjugative element protein (TIGR02256 family)